MTVNIYLLLITVVVILLLGVYYLLFTNPEQQSISVAPTSTPLTYVKIGLLLPLSGERAAVGEMALAGAQLAAQEINRSGGMNGSQFQIISEDDGCSKEGGTAAMTRLIVVHQVTAVVGSVCAAATETAVLIAQVAGVPTISVSAGEPTPTKAGDFIFRAYPSDRVQAVAAAEYLVKKSKRTKAAVVAGPEAWAKMLIETFSSYFQELKGTVVTQEILSAGIPEKELRAVVTKLKKARVDTLYLAAAPELAAAVVKEIRQQKIKMIVVGGQSWDGGYAENFSATATPPDGVTYVLPKLIVTEEFKARLKETLGKEANRFTAVVYDVVRLLSETMKQAGTDKKTIRNVLLRVTYDQGLVLPLIQFNEQRDLKGVLFVLQTASGTLIQTEDVDWGLGTSTPVTSTIPWL